jgi:parallel beta-helix repeat protein
MRGRFISVSLAILLILSFLVISPQKVSADSYMVTNTNDSGEGSLRQAISDANSNAVPDIINFDPSVFSPSSPAIITLLSTLPALTDDSTTIEGNGGVILTADSLYILNGIEVKSNGNIIRGLQIKGFWTGILFNRDFQTQNNVIGGTEASQGNLFLDNKQVDICLEGSNNTNNLIIGNNISSGASTGIEISQEAHDNIIGGPTINERNIINGHSTGINISNSSNNIIQGNVVSDNSHSGIILSSPTTANNHVIGNYIGVDASGEFAWGSQAIGVNIEHGAHHNVVGGTTAEERNIISGNTFAGVGISDPNLEGTSYNHIRGNYIGTDYSGTKAIPNNQGGVGIDDKATGNVIGGTEPGAGNVISGNTGVTPHGIRISRTSGNYVYGNIIGLTADGSSSLENGIGIQLEYGANNNFIGGTEANMRNIISGEGNSGICLYQSNGNAIQGNYIGTDFSGTKAIGPDYTGITIDNSEDNLIGGTEPGARNLISGNHYYGIHIYGVNSNNNTVTGNYIGCDVTGTISLGNQNDGIRIGGGATNNVIGGTTASARNIISGNLHYGIAIQNIDTTGNQILGNYIGTDYAGTVALSNGEMGIILDDYPSYTIIGGTTAGAGNLISGNNGTGIQIGNYSSHTQVQGNFIGTDATGTNAITNKGYGIMIGGSAHHNTIGGNVAGARNLISGNKYMKDGTEPIGIGIGILSNANNNLITGNYIGTEITGTADLGNDYGIHIWCAQNNIISNNVIHYNTVRGVNIDNIGAIYNKVTQNSLTENDGTAPEGGIWLANGANEGILPPVITSVTMDTVTGTSSAPDNSIVEIFQDAGYQGNIYIGSATVTSHSFTFIGSAPSGATGGNLTATVTDLSGNTSIFSTPVINNLGSSSPPEEQIEQIQDEFDEAVSDGGLVGEGPTPTSANGKLKALKNMLESTEELINEGKISEAIQQLEDIYKRVDGNPKPPDFVTGDEREALADMILNLIDELRNL